jgi:hypothetical protein
MHVESGSQLTASSAKKLIQHSPHTAVDIRFLHSGPQSEAIGFIVETRSPEFADKARQAIVAILNAGPFVCPNPSSHFAAANLASAAMRWRAMRRIRTRSVPSRGQFLRFPERASERNSRDHADPRLFRHRSIPR